MIDLQFRLREPRQVLGTPIRGVLFVARNGSDHPMSFSIGNERANDFRCVATPAVVENDPYYWGGIMAVNEIRPGETWRRDISLYRYLQFRSPGRYSVSCAIDL